MALLDTTVLIDLNLRPRSPLRRRADAVTAALVSRGEELCTSRINEAEFRVGAFRALDPARETARIDMLLSKLVILEFDATAARRYAEAQAHLLNIGKPSGEADVFIAAVALANGQRLVTRNPAHFANIPGLVIEAY
ncbi:MAG: type II toxin-antitoxin system VapC family toxin [Tepidisphaeraceae bacterium]